jgi:hypothetical protein
MQQRQLRLGDILDDYCPRERRVTNHAIVAMVGEDVKQTRCTTCDAEHEFKHAKVPRQRRKNEAPAALYAQVAASAPKRVTHETPASIDTDHEADRDAPASAEPQSVELPSEEPVNEPVAPIAASAPIEAPQTTAPPDPEDAPVDGDEPIDEDKDEGPIHRRLIRASLPRPEGQQPPARPIPEFTIRQPGGRPNRFRPRHQRGGPQQQGGGGHHFQGNRSNGNMGGPGRGQRPGGGGGGRPGLMKRHGPPGRKRSK